MASSEFTLTPTSASQPVFLDPDGRRARGWRRFWLVVGATVTLLAALLAIAVAIPPLLPSLPISHQIVPPVALTHDARERLAIRHSLDQAFHKPVPSRHGRFIPPGGSRLIAQRGTPSDPIIAGFFVDWQDNSLVSLEQHVNDLDWVVCEWSFISAAGDSVVMDSLFDSIAPRVFDVMRKAKDPPSILIMLSNFDHRSRDFSVPILRAFLSSPAARVKGIAQMRDLVVRDSLAGVTVDFENVPDDLEKPMVEFIRELRSTLAPLKRIVTTAIPAYATPKETAQLATVNDYLFAMLFDEHYGSGAPGPIASQDFYVRHARAIVNEVPRDKVILMTGAYGYDWHDDSSQTQSVTFEEVMQLSRDHHAATQFDRASLNPYIAWEDPDSVDHVVWYLDAVTMYNELQVARDLGAVGMGIWRLGEEDPTVWRVLDRHGLTGVADSLSTVRPGYDVEFVNDVVCGTSRVPRAMVHGESPCVDRGQQPDSGGDILHIREYPTAGQRTISVDHATGLVMSDSITELPTSYVVDRYGQKEHRVALTFDDGPDGHWTPLILDTLEKYHAPATFFMIGQNINDHLLLTRRVYNEGHEIGNHTFSHPNLELLSNQSINWQLSAMESVLESVIGHRTALFRPPYFGDATPSTPEELRAAWVANQRGYYTVGLRDDSEDWKTWISVDSIIKLTMAGRDTGNVILMHDGGGNRAHTLAALGPIIDSLRADDDTLVLLSDLVGLSRDEVMPPLPRIDAVPRMLHLAGWAALGIGELTLYWLFMVAVFLGIGRLLIIATLAIIQRISRHQHRGGPVKFTPPVSVIVPAYNEAKVVVRTVRTLLKQQYAGPIEIIVVDDGSSDNTYEVARTAFADEPAVAVFHKDNGGKASALNLGITYAKHDIVIALDADTLFANDTIAELVQPLADSKVGAVAGNAKVGNRVNLVTRWQALEYVTSQNLDRRAFSLLNGITVVPGAVGAWRKSLVIEADGFRGDTLAEDQDLTLSIRRKGHSIAYADGAIGYTEAPDTLRTLARQRFRWSFGTLQCAWKHRDTMFRPRYGGLGWAALPNVWLFQLLLPALSPLADLAFLYSLVSIVLTRYQHGATYAMASMEHVFTYYALFLCVDWLSAVIAFLMEPGEDRSLTWLILIQRFAYRQLMYWVVVRSFKTAFQGHGVGWGKLERKATVQLPAAT